MAIYIGTVCGFEYLKIRERSDDDTEAWMKDIHEMAEAAKIVAEH